MKKAIWMAAAALAGAAAFAAAHDYVDTKIGTGGGGNTCPGPVWPLGMVQPGPDTTLVTKPHDHDPEEFSHAVDYRSMCNGYDPKSEILLGFTQTHLSGTGCCDLQDFLLLPFSGEYPEARKERFVAKMDKSSEVTKAGYYAVTLPEFGVRAEVTASKRVAYHRYTWAKGGTGRVFVDMQAGCWPWFRWYSQNQPRHRVVWSESKASPDGVVEAYNRVTCWNNEREIFCRMEFSKKPAKITEMPRWEKCGRRYVLDFDVKPGEPVVAKVAISSVDEDGARANMKSDPPDFDFDARRAACEKAWDDLFACAACEGTDYQKKLFYTALYHAYVQPNLFSDVDGRCRFQDVGKHGKVIDAVRPAQAGEIYTTLSTWDTFRAAHPLYTILTPHYAGEFAESMIAYWRALGKMPKWQMFGGENYCMIGPHSITIVADALLKGLMRTDAKTVEKAVEDSLVKYNGRGTATDVYSKLGYLPCDRAGGTVSSALEWGLVDYAAAKVAERAGDAKTAAERYRTSRFYRNLFDRPTGMMRARFADGSWRTPFDPYKQKPTKEDEKNRIPNDYTEGGAMQYAWHVLQDPAGLAALHGGPEGFAKALDKLFTDHTQVGADAATGECSGTIGQFALGNEHDQHVPYLWQYAGRPDKTAEIVRELCDRYFNDTAEGLCGNDDCGQISAWYVFACLGFYPVNPVGGEYVLGAPQVPRVTVRLGGGKAFTVVAKNYSRANRYVKSVTLDGKPMKGFIITQAQLAAGGELVFEMTDRPVAAVAPAARAGQWYDAKCGIPPLNTDREAVVKFFAENVYGVRPEFPDFKPKYELVKTRDCGFCVRREVRINTMTPLGETNFLAVAYFPKKEGKVPVWVMPAFNDETQDIRCFWDAHLPGRVTRWPVDLIVSNGHATVMFVNRTVLDDEANILDGVKRPANGWGAIDTWALAASRCADWLGTQPEADLSKLAVVGLSRLGKTALWAGVTDTRFALVAPNCSGLFGARCTTVTVHGETIERITRVFPHWFAPQCRTRWSGKDRDLPFDQHWLLAAVAPRLLAVGSASEDWWASPSGELAAFFQARNAWKNPKDCDYHVRRGGHHLLREDWAKYIEFSKQHGW